MKGTMRMGMAEPGDSQFYQKSGGSRQHWTGYRATFHGGLGYLHASAQEKTLIQASIHFKETENLYYFTPVLRS